MSFCFATESQFTLAQISPPLEDSNCRDQGDLKAPQLTSAPFSQSLRRGQTGLGSRCILSALCVPVLYRLIGRNLYILIPLLGQASLISQIWLLMPCPTKDLCKEVGFPGTLPSSAVTELSPKRHCA